MKRLSTSLVLLFLSVLFGTTATVQAQTVDDVLRYSREFPSYDANSIVMPGIASHSGFGAYQDNPASMALAEDGYFSFELSSRYVNETGTYLGNNTDFSDNQTGVGNLGLLYKVPTSRGSLVVGGGYSQTNDFNRASSVNGRNNNSTITDLYSFRGEEYQAQLNTAAFNAFAIDDVSNDSSASIFRFGLPYSQYPGINQSVEVTESGQLGEYSAFIATEAFKNFYLGASIGYNYGLYSYRRDFLESDRQNDYSDQIIDSDDDGTFDTDIDNIVSIYTIDTELQAFSARLGAVYQPTEQFNIGASFQFPSKVIVNEDYDTEIITTFDNGSEASDVASQSSSYNVVRPPRLKGGITYTSKQGLSITAMAEGVFYSDIEYDQEGISDFETIINDEIASTFNDVINFRGGLEYKMNEQFTPRIGYGYYPNPTDVFGTERQFFSGGFSARVSPEITLNIGVQYSVWETENLLYDYERPDGQILDETVREDVSKLHVMGGVKVAM